jgi:hypothetical protein
MSSRPTWQHGLHRETLSQKTNKKFFKDLTDLWGLHSAWQYIHGNYSIFIKLSAGGSCL